MSSPTTSANHAHGIMGETSWKLPTCVATSSVANRADQGNTIKANEYMDDPNVLREKMKVVSELIKKSKCLTAYTGAGLSRAAGIADYASKASKSVVNNAPKLASSFDAQPTYAHKVLVALERTGYLKHYVQQNHDGLPQKAGFPQEKLNEIHGAWYDPSNPVVKFNGTLRGDLFEWMENMENQVDLCLCLGTSLSGMNADRMAVTPAERARAGEEGVLGTVMINLQRTHLDDSCSVRVWAKLDDAFKLLTEFLGINDDTVMNIKPPKVPKGDLFQIPYNKQGLLDRTCVMELDLSKGSKMVVAPSEASNHKNPCTMNGKDREGNYLCQFEGIQRRMGKWWIPELIAGNVPYVPVINQRPKIKKTEASGSTTTTDLIKTLETELKSTKIT